MGTNAQVGEWVEITRVVLEPRERLSSVPQDTAQVGLEMKVTGFLQNENARIGDTVKIKTMVGRIWQGRLWAIKPSPTHTFGPPVTELSNVGTTLRAVLRGTEQEGSDSR